jgi:hypothetical protein
MFITDDTKALTARKDAQAFHRNHKIKSINDVVVHTMDWDALGKMHRDAGKARCDPHPSSNAGGGPISRRFNSGPAYGAKLLRGHNETKKVEGR